MPMKLDYMVLVNQFLKSSEWLSEGILSTFIFKFSTFLWVDTWIDFLSEAPAQARITHEESEMSMNLGLESIFIQSRHRSMYWNACADRQTIPGSEIGGIPRIVTWRKIVSEETRILARLF
jgi:hypothetical protein